METGREIEGGCICIAHQPKRQINPVGLHPWFLPTQRLQSHCAEEGAQNSMRMHQTPPRRPYVNPTKPNGPPSHGGGGQDNFHPAPQGAWRYSV